MPFNKLYFVIPTYHRESELRKCLTQISSQAQDITLNIVVVDSGLSVNTKMLYPLSISDLFILEGSPDLWWTGSIVLGMKFAIEKNASHIIWTNDDCFMSNGSLKHLIDLISELPESIIGSSCLEKINGELISIPTGSVGRIPVLASYGSLVQVDEMSGHFVCIPRSVIEKIGFPNAKMAPQYHGDSTYILKATKAGFKAYISGDVVIVHKGKIKRTVRDFCDLSERRLKQSFTSLFLSKKSIFYFPALSYYYTTKYGGLFGVILFSLKSMYLIYVWLLLYFSSRIA